MPNYRKIVAPLLKLLSKNTDGVWTTEHTGALNQIAEHVYGRIRLGLCDMQLPIELYVDVDDEYCHGILAQGK